MGAEELVSAHTGHETVTEIVLAVCAVFDIFPLEFGSAAAGRCISQVLY